MTQKHAGVLLGLACGDALGRPIEFNTREEIREGYGTVTEMKGNGTHRKPAGTITDDTEQALCIARSLAEHSELNPEDIADRFVEWYRSRPFDIGLTTRAALQHLDNGVPWNMAGKRALEERGPRFGAGNGSVMRTPPVAMAFTDDREQLIEASKATSRITHTDPRCVAGAAVLNLVIAGYLRGTDDPFVDAFEWIESETDDEMMIELRDRLQKVRDDPPPDDTLPNGGYVIDTLEAALTIALDAENLEEAVVRAVNLGGDTDTIGAVVGSVTGARFGAEAIPERWLNHIDEEDELRYLAHELMSLQS